MPFGRSYFKELPWQSAETRVSKRLTQMSSAEAVELWKRFHRLPDARLFFQLPVVMSHFGSSFCLECMFCTISQLRVHLVAFGLASSPHEECVTLFEPANRWSFYRQGTLNATGSRLTPCRHTINLNARTDHCSTITGLVAKITSRRRNFASSAHLIRRKS